VYNVGNKWRRYMSITNGDGKQPLTANELQVMQRMVGNILAARQEWLRRVTGGDPRRDIADECGYNKNPTVQDYQDLVDRHSIAGKVNSLWAEESWQVSPSVYEDEDSETVTPFEQAWDALDKQLAGEESFFEEEEGGAIFPALELVDKLSGIGHYGVLLLGVDDGRELNQPVRGYNEKNTAPAGRDHDGKLYVPSVNGVYSLTVNVEQTTGRQLLYLSAFPESLAPVVQWEANKTSRRYGQPTMYRVTMCDPTKEGEVGTPPAATEDVHWTRVIHVADTFHHAPTSLVMAVPRLQPVLDHLYNLSKLYGADAEAYWRNCVAKMILETQPSDGGDVDVDHTSLKDMFERAGTGMQAYYFLRNLTGKVLPPLVCDPTNHILAQLQAIAIKIGCPLRVLMGSEQGKLAADQDSTKWNKSLARRQKNYNTPRLIRPFVNRLVGVGVLPRPADSVKCDWPAINTQNDLEKAQIFLVKTQALAAYVSGNVESLVPPLDYLTRYGGETEEEAQATLDNAEELAVDRVEEDLEKRHTEIDEGLVPDPTKPPPGKVMPGAPVKNEATAAPDPTHPFWESTLKAIEEIKQQIEREKTVNVINNMPAQPIEVHTHHAHTLPPAPNVTVENHVPEQPAPQVTVNMPEPPVMQPQIIVQPSTAVIENRVDVQPTPVTVNTPAITNEVTVNVPEPTIAEVNVKLEPTTKTVEIKRTSDGKYEGTVTEE
jgi:uncharacterized protein